MTWNGLARAILFVNRPMKRTTLPINWQHTPTANMTLRAALHASQLSAVRAILEDALASAGETLREEHSESDGIAAHAIQQLAMECLGAMLPTCAQSTLPKGECRPSRAGQA